MDDPGTRLWLPTLGLAGCVRAAMLRDTRDHVAPLSVCENYFPAAPLVTIYWWFTGEGQWIERPGFSAPLPDYRLGPLMLAGPYTRPTYTRTIGPMHALMLMFLPDAFQQLTGIGVPTLVNRVVPAQTLLPSDWVDWAMSLHADVDDDVRLTGIVEFLQPRWRSLAPTRPAPQRYAEWAQALAVRAATSAAGRSLRQTERRIKAWTGLPMREIRAASRAERAFLAVAADDASVDWAGIAADTQYADQSHLCRETRRLTGFSPEKLRQLIQVDPAFWSYRLWR